MSWSTLSEDVWKHILLHVPLAHRLDSCSRVSTTLYRAAAAATQQIALGEGPVRRLPGLCHWMMQHGQHLTSLRLGPYGASSVRHFGPDCDSTLTQLLSQLPCANLRELDLHDLRVQLDVSTAHPGVLHSCTRLTKLILNYCTLMDGQSGLTAVSALVGLQHLELTMSAVVSESRSQSRLFETSTVLQHLTQLTHLYLRGVDRAQNTFPMEHISCLANLQELNISNCGVPVSPSTTPGLSKLTALRKFSLQRASFNPSSLCHVQQLQSLELCNLRDGWPVAAAAPAYSSLTASSHLQKLSVHIDNLPPGVWQHAFPPGLQLPMLREVTLFCYGWDASSPPPAAALETDDLSRIISCCPGLHTIRVDLQPGAQLTALAKVSGLTRLAVAFLQAEGLQSLRALSGLASLQALSVDLGGPITPQDLLCLTALTGLTELCIDPDTAPEWEGAEDVDISLTQECHTGMQRDPPVWLQLVEHCVQFSKCQPLVINSMGQQLAAQQQQIAELQTQLATTTAQAHSALAAAAAAQAAATAAAEVVACAAAAEAGELRGRLQAVEGQMQQLLQAMLHPGR